MEQTNQRDNRGDDFKSRQNTDRDAVIAQELKNLFKNGSSEYNTLTKLRQKYKDEEVVNAILDAYRERQEEIMKKARKFKEMITQRYAPMNLSYDQLIKKAKKYQKRLNQKKMQLSDDEFQYFINITVSDKSYPSMGFLPNTAMSKTLGYDAIVSSPDRLNIKDTEMDVLQEILKLYGETKPLHSQIVIQSLTYRDVAPEALVGEYSSQRNNVYSYVHPIIAALFIPKIKLLDEQLLIANIGYIVQAKHKGTPIMTKPDFGLYWDLITDPNGHVCSIDSPIKDLRNRFILQTRIWQSVLNLRQGRYYNENLNDFLLAIDNCRNNIYDAPDLTYVKDEGAILRRILSAFSLRPTLVSTTKLYGMMGCGSPFNYGAQNVFSTQSMGQITSVPMVTLRLPLNVGNQSIAVSLEEAFTQPQWYVENKMFVPKAQTIMHSRDVLFFYVGRRFQMVNISRINTPYNFTSLPMTVAGWESVNDRVVNFERTMTIMNDEFQLRSVVLVERSQQNKNLIIGTSTVIITPRNVGEGRLEENFLLYDPQGAAELFKSEGSFVRNSPITYIPGDTPFNTNGSVESFTQRASTRGTIFMYEKMGGADGNCYLKC